jgi:hypothetical protein
MPASHAGEAAGADAPCWKEAARSADIAGYALSKVQRWLHERALKNIDPETGLYRARGQWDYWNTAADCYPFLCWAAYVVDPEALDGPLRKILHVEQKLCNHLDRIPTRWDFETGAKDTSLSHEKLIFGASEYVKDGLIAVVEVTGRDEWFERMKGIEEDVWKHARVDTPFGKIPSTDIEVNGEQLQALARLHTMTGEAKFLKWAQRLADSYLSDADFVPKRLRDHGCEIIGGLGLLLGIESEVAPDTASKRLPRLKRMFDEIVQRGCNADGLMYDTLGKKGRLSDGWGYNYVGFLCYDWAAGKPVYRERIEATLRALGKPRYTKKSPWRGVDSCADSVEGGLYLLNRVPVEEGFAWADREMARQVTRSNQPLEKAKLWGVTKWDCNGVRTVIIHALMHTRGLLARPWRRDLKLGACEREDGLAIVVKAQTDWSGTLVFDIPRHTLYMGFQRDWPRMNTLPEWFTVALDQSYDVRTADGTPLGTLTGQALHDGLAVQVKAGEPLRLLVQPAGVSN